MQARLRHRRSVSRGLSRPRRLLRGIWVVTLAVSVSSTMSQAALAAGSPSPVIPSQAQVDAAKTAVTSQESRVAATGGWLPGCQRRGCNAPARGQPSRRRVCRRGSERRTSRRGVAHRPSGCRPGRCCCASGTRRSGPDGGGGIRAERQHWRAAPGPVWARKARSGPSTWRSTSRMPPGALDRQLARCHHARRSRRLSDRCGAQERSRVLAEAAAAQADSLASMQAELDAATGALNDLAARQRAMVTELAALQNTSEDIQQERLDGLAAVAAAKAAEQAAAEQAAREAAARAAAAAAAAAADGDSQPHDGHDRARPRPKPSPSTTKPTTSSASSTSPTSSSSPSTSDSAEDHGPADPLGAEKPQDGGSAAHAEVRLRLPANGPAWSRCGRRKAAGTGQPTTPTPALTASRRPFRAPRWPRRCADWLINPTTQITWGLGYIKGRYGTPCARPGRCLAVAQPALVLSPRILRARGHADECPRILSLRSVPPEASTGLEIRAGRHPHGRSGPAHARSGRAGVPTRRRRTRTVR
jgi:hypothetical protein